MKVLQNKKQNEAHQTKIVISWRINSTIFNYLINYNIIMMKIITQTI